MPNDFAALHAIADRLTPPLRRAFLAAVAELQARIDLNALEHAIASGSPGAVDALLRPDRLSSDLAAAVAILRDGLAQGGDEAANQLADTLSASLRFDSTLPLAANAADRLAASFLKDVTDETRAAVRAAVARGIRQNIAPRDLAVQLRAMIGLTERQQMAVINYRFSLLQQNLSGTRVAQLADIYTRRQLAGRALTISRTETIAAVNAGQLALWRSAKQDGLLDTDARKKWIVTPDDRLCPRCQELAGQTVLLHEAFVAEDGTMVMAPPLHTRCRCAIALAFAEKAQAA